MRRIVIGLAIIATLAVVTVLAAGYYATGPLGGVLGLEVTTHQPVGARTLGEGGDPLVVEVTVVWPEEGYCSGQFQVTATKSASEVRVSEVVSRVRRAGGSWAGLGTQDGLAWVPLELAAPLAQRRLVRDSDGVQLPLDRR